MAKIGDKLGKLSLAILENFVENKLGKKFVDELRAPTQEAINIATALETAQERFIREYGDRDLSKALFVDLKQIDRPLLKDAIKKFYVHPTDSDFHQKLKDILLNEFSSLSEDRANNAIAFYVNILLEELALTDVNFRENVRTIADLRGERTQQDMAYTLRRVENLLAINTQSRSDPANARALHQLPATPADFIGRESEIKELTADFRSGKGTVVSGLIGMGGIGKTTLGLIVAHQLKDQYPDAQIFLDLKGTTSPIEPESAIRHVILSFEPDFDFRGMDNARLASAYQSTLHDKRVLLFWDNARSAEQIKPLLPPEKCASLITSRWSFPLPGMGSHRIGVLEENEAVSFLLDICPRIDAHAPALARVCGFLPLALRIAASFLAINVDWNPSDYLDRLAKQRLNTLQSVDKAEPDVESTFELSYKQLTEDERKKWRSLSVLPLFFNRAEASAIWDVDDVTAHDILSRLCRYSILDYEESRGYYRVHDLLAEFAKARLSEAESDKATLRYNRISLVALQNKYEELTNFIGRFLHANASTLLTVAHSLNIAIQILSPSPFKSDGVPTTEEAEQVLTPYAGQLANAIEELFIVAKQHGDENSLPTEEWDRLKKCKSALHDFTQRLTSPELAVAILRYVSHSVNQICKEHTFRTLPGEVIANLQQTAWQLERVTSLITILRTRIDVLDTDYELRSARDFIVFNLRESKKVARIPISHLIEKSIEDLSSYAQDSGVLIKVVNNQDGIIEVNEREVVRAISHLLHNAIKYSWKRVGEQQSSVSVSARIQDQFVKIEIENLT